MAKKPGKPNFNQALEILRAHSFDVGAYPGASGAMLVTKHGVGAVLVPAADPNSPGALLIGPGIVMRGEVARLVDHGYQKFFTAAHHELPAMANHLQAVHKFSEELKKLTGVESLYNESLGTVSDVYLYDRLQGRADVKPNAGKEQLPAGQ